MGIREHTLLVPTGPSGFEKRFGKSQRRIRLPDSLQVGGYKQFTVSNSRCRCCAENPLQTSTVLSHHCCETGYRLVPRHLNCTLQGVSARKLPTASEVRR